MFTVTLHHLAPDGKKAGVQYVDAELRDVPEGRLHALLASLAALAGEPHGAARPEVRITAPHGQFVVQIADGQLHFNSWTLRAGGCDLTAEQIFAAIVGLDEAQPDAAAGAGAGRGKRSRWLRVGVLAGLILGSNAVTAWMFLRTPPNPFLPDYTLLVAEPAERVLADLAGDYRTGSAEGDRGLKIARDGRIHWMKFAEGGGSTEESDLTAKAVQSRGRPALLTSDYALIEILDGSTVKFYGDTYRRKVP